MSVECHSPGGAAGAVDVSGVTGAGVGVLSTGAGVDTGAGVAAGAGVAGAAGATGATGVVAMGVVYPFLISERSMAFLEL